MQPDQVSQHESYLLMTISTPFRNSDRLTVIPFKERSLIGRRHGQMWLLTVKSTVCEMRSCVDW
jgi:hypothetical protein